MDYTNLYDFTTSSGVIVPNDKSVISGIQKKFQEIFGTDIDLSAETPVGRLIEAMAVVVKTTLGVNAQSANQFNINVATGVYLDSLARIYDLSRITGTKTRITIKVFFSQPVTDPIPAGSLIMSSSNGEMFSIDSTIENKGSIDVDTGKIYAEGTATAVNVGPVVAAYGTVTSIQTPTIGWVGVTNVAPTYTGTNIETDEEFRKRILQSRPVGVGFRSHLVSALNRLDGVYSSCVLENNTGDWAAKLDVPIPAHSIFVCVDCIETEELYSQIASEVARSKPVGTGMVNSSLKSGTLVTQTVSYGYDGADSTTISFYKAGKTAIRVSLTYSLGNYTGSNVVEDISQVVANYVSTVGVGGKVYGAMISNALINSLNIGIGSVEIAKDGSKDAADTVVEMYGYETPYTSADYITATSID